MLLDQSTVRKSIWLAWVLMFAGLIATTVTAIYMKIDIVSEAKREFDFACSQIQIRIGARMDANALILTSTAALFDASDEVTREDLMRGILRGWDMEEGKHIRLQIFDNAQLSADSLLYDSQPNGEMEPENALRLTSQTQTSFNDPIWYLCFTQMDGQLEYGRIYGVLSAGTIISLLLFGLLVALLNTRFRAQRLAYQLTVDLRESEQSYRNQFANNSAAMLLIDPADDAIIDINTAATTFYGYPRERLLNMRITDINTLPGSEVRQAMASVSQKQGQWFEFQHCLADGSLRDVEVSASSINFGGRTVLHLIIHDITERRRAEDGLRQANETLEKLVRERSLELEMFSYSVSHDLRAPLRHLIGFVQLLNKKAPESLDEKIRHYLTVISDSATQMSMLVDGLLSFSRMGRSEMTVVRVRFDKLIHEVLNTLQAENDGRNIVWNIGPLPEVMGDPVMLHIVMMSLVSNAIKFTRNKSRAEISIACTSGNSGEHIFSVRDNGAGFDMKYYDKLFNLFKRLHRIEDFEGTGVGLANVLRIVQRHGGRSWAEGVVGSGSVFYFSLPTTPQVDERS